MDALPLKRVAAGRPAGLLGIPVRAVGDRGYAAVGGLGNEGGNVGGEPTGQVRLAKGAGADAHFVNGVSAAAFKDGCGQFHDLTAADRAGAAVGEGAFNLQGDDEVGRAGADIDLRAGGNKNVVGAIGLDVVLGIKEAGEIGSGTRAAFAAAAVRIRRSERWRGKNPLYMPPQGTEAGLLLPTGVKLSKLKLASQASMLAPPFESVDCP